MGKEDFKNIDYASKMQIPHKKRFIKNTSSQTNYNLVKQKFALPEDTENIDRAAGESKIGEDETETMMFYVPGKVREELLHETMKHIEVQNSHDRQPYAPPDSITVKQELFCQNFVKYRNRNIALAKAGYRPTIDRFKMLMEKKHVVKRVLQLIEYDKALNRVNESYIIAKLKNIADAKITDVLEVDEATQTITIRDLEKVPKGTIDAIQEIRNTQYGIVVKFYDKTKALLEMGKNIGMFVERLKLTDDLDIEVQDFTSGTYARAIEESGAQKEEQKKEITAGKKGDENGEKNGEK